LYDESPNVAFSSSSSSVGGVSWLKNGEIIQVTAGHPR